MAYITSPASLLFTVKRAITIIILANLRRRLPLCSLPHYCAVEMSSSSPTSTKAPVIGEVHDVYGYKFRWTEQHQTEEQLKPLLYTCDSAASEVLERVQEYKVANGKTTTGQAAREDLYELVKELAQTGEDEVITKFWDQVNTVPDWVDWEQIKRGQDVNKCYPLYGKRIY